MERIEETQPQVGFEVESNDASSTENSGHTESISLESNVITPSTTQWDYNHEDSSHQKLLFDYPVWKM